MKTFKIMIADLQIEDKTEYFQKAFLKVNINIKIIIKDTFYQTQQCGFVFFKKKTHIESFI